MNEHYLWLLICLAAGTVLLFLAAGRIRPAAQRHRPNFRTHLDLDKMDILIETRRYEEAEQACRKVLEKYPDDHEAYCFLSNMLTYLGKEDEACAELMPLAACARPRDPWVFVHLGYLFAVDGKYSMAKWALDRGLERFPHDVDLLSSRSRLSLQTSEKIAALGYAQQALLEDPQDLNALWAKVLALEALESYDEAEAVLDELKKASADDGEIAAERAHVALLRGDTENALLICEKEMMRAPRSTAVCLVRSAVLARAGRYQEALTQVERAAELGESEEAVSWSKLEPLCGLGRWDEAYEILDDLIRQASPLVNQLRGDAARKDYPLLTGSPEFLDFLEIGRSALYNEFCSIHCSEVDDGSEND